MRLDEKNVRMEGEGPKRCEIIFERLKETNLSMTTIEISTRRDILMVISI